LLEKATQEAASLEDLIRQLVRWRSGEETPPSEDGDLQRLEGEEGAVQILTLHMAKGLEAPIVAIFAFGQGRPATVHRYHANGRRCLYVGPLPGGSLKEQVDREDDEERQRLLYVALTRAQAKLVLFAFEQIDSKGNYRKVRGAYEVLNRRLLARKQQGFPPLFRLEEMPYTRLEAMQERDAPDLSTLVLPALAKPDLPDYAALRFQARPFITTSYTALQHQLEDMEDTSRGDRDQPGARPAYEDLPGGTHVGQTLHELLEWADLDLVRETPFEAWKLRQEVRDCIQETLRLHGVPLRCETRVGQLVHTALSTSLPLGPDGGTLQICRTDRCLRETDFLMRWIDADPLSEAKDLLKGSIDLLCEQDGRTYFLDWKSNLLAGYDFESLAACVEHGYQLQAKIYLQASLAFLDIRDETDYEKRFGGILYVFLRGIPDEGTWFHRPSWAEAKLWKQELQMLHKEVIHA
jgi:exodeoxyribonuclease V beta subunit